MLIMPSLDQLIGQIDNAIRCVFPPTQRSSQRANPAHNLSEPALSKEEAQHVARLMRVNHSGEVCAQALYQGQALTAQLSTIKAQMTESANEEIEHLAWCEQRLRELGSEPSRLNVLWYSGSFLLGAIAGLAGDQWSLGFVAETEHQVSAHLQKHLQRIPTQDIKTHAILTQMHEDERHHEASAHRAGAAELPAFIKIAMTAVSKVLTVSSYYL